MNNFQVKLYNIVKASIPVIQVVTYEWQRLYGFCAFIASKTQRLLYSWSEVSGLKKWNEETKEFKSEKDDLDSLEVLEWFREEVSNSLLILEDYHSFIKDGSHRNIRFIRELTRINPQHKKTIIMQVPFPINIQEFEKEIPQLELELPREETLEEVLKYVISELDYDNKPKPSDLKEILSSSKGLSIMEAEWTYKKIIAQKNRLTKTEVKLIVEEKEQIIKKSGILEYFHPQGDFSAVGGMENLKEWLEKRGKGFSKDAKDFGLKSPKGVMLLGVPGCGKSLLSKTIANEWQLPLLKFDLGKVFGSLVGESERKMRDALKLAEAISPSILWIDEIEKGLSGLNTNADSGVSAKVFGTLLTWMQEKKEEVFVIATANNIGSLPPELLRKGRFDEIFFVDLPSKIEREEIFKIHIENRDRELKDYDLEALLNASINFSGAEIEEAINEALFIAYDNGRDMETEDIVKALEETYPLSKTMSEDIKELRKWAKVKARFASKENLEPLAQLDKDIPILSHEKPNFFVK